MARAAVIPQSPPARGRANTTTARGRPSAATATTAAARAKAKTGPAKPATKRTARAAETTDDDDDEIAVDDKEKKKTAARGRAKASTTTTTTTTTTTGAGRGRKPAARTVAAQEESDDDDELAQMDVPKKRVGRPKKETTAAPQPAARPRGRPKGATNANSTTATATARSRRTDAEESSKPKEFAINSAALRSNILKGPAKKKTVTFQDVSGSEDEEEEPAPAPAAGRRRGTPAKRQTGLAAKPARKPATATGRVRKPATKQSKQAKPLSPKKANQVAKSISSYVSSDGEDDELAGGKDQIKLHAASPAKHGSENTGLSSPVRRINLTPRHKSVDENGKPVRQSIDFNDIISMPSPTREPSPSPFHYTLRETPRRVGLALAEEHTKAPISQPDFGRSQNSPLKASPKKALLETPRGSGGFAFNDVKPSFQPNFTPGQNSPLKASPKKGHFDTPKASSMAPWDGTKPLSQPIFTPGQNSPLKASARKGNLAASFSESAMKSSTPSFNARISLLQSPAKRVASPFKGSFTPKRSALFAPREVGSTTPRDEAEGDGAPAGSPPQMEEPIKLGELDEGRDPSDDELGHEFDHDMHDHDSQATIDEEMDDGQQPEQEAQHGDELHETDNPEPQSHFVIDEDIDEDHEQDIEQPARELEYETDGSVHEPETQLQAGANEEMDEDPAEFDAEHETPDVQDNADYAQEDAEAPTYEELERQVDDESSLDLGEELAENFAEKDLEVNPNHYEAPADHPVEQHEYDNDSIEDLDHSAENQDAEVDEADQLVEAVLQDFKNLTEEPAEPEDGDGGVDDRIAALETEVEAEMQEDVGQGSDRDDEHDGAVSDDEPELPVQRDVPDEDTGQGFDREDDHDHDIEEELEVPIQQHAPEENIAQGSDQADEHEDIEDEPEVPVRQDVAEDIAQGSDQDDHDQDIEDEPELPAQHVSEEEEAIIGEPPAIESAPEHLDAEDDMESNDDVDFEDDIEEVPVHEDVQEEDEEGEEGDEDEDWNVDGTTLVVFDDEQMYMEGARLASPCRSPRRVSPRASPRRIIQVQPEPSREPSPEHVESVPPPVPAPALADNQYRDDDKMDSDEDVQSEAAIAANHPETARPETPEPEAPASSLRPSVHRSIFDNAPRFTPLADQFSQWQTGTPHEQQAGSQTGRPRRGVFSIGGVPRRPSSGRISVGSDVSYPDLQRSLRSRKSSLGNVTAQEDVEDEDMAEPELELEEPEEQEQEPEQEPEEQEPEVVPEPEAEPETLEDAAAKAAESRQPITEIYADPEPEADAERGDVEAPDSIPSQDAAPAPVPSVHDLSDDEKENENELPPAPAPMTPMTNNTSPLKTLHTVSKVPLKPEGDISPLKMPLKRRRSLSNASPTRSSQRLRKSALFAPAPAQVEGNVPEFSPRKGPRIMEEHDSPAWRARARSVERRQSRASSGTKTPSQSPSPVKSRRTSKYRARSVERRQSRPSTKMSSRSPSPVKSPRKSMGSNGVLNGAVVFVDVHTTEGEDASGIFVELLQQMGARCVKNWAWNPRASLLPTEFSAEQKDGKVGITHVIYKDGGVRTLEKVRHAAGLVKCVGVGWVLDCERENKWLDETNYAVDSTIIPRGGAKRRKSMEPRALSNVNGTLVSTSAAAAARRQSNITSSSEEPRTPTSTRTKKYDTPTAKDKHHQTPKTPGTGYGYRFNMDDYVGMSPATPFYLSRAKLVQQTCPPKQTRQGLFGASDDCGESVDVGVGVADGDGETSRRLKMRLEAARRKSLAYKPRRGSPLA